MRYLARISNKRNPTPKTAFSFENTIVSFNADIHDVVIGVSANQLSENHRHLMTTLSFAGTFLEPEAYDWGSISSGDSVLTEAVASGGRAPEENCVGNLIVYQKCRH